jgi:hypothetical protein
MEPAAMELTGMEPAAMELTGMEPAAMEHAATKATAMEPAAAVKTATAAAVKTATAAAVTAAATTTAVRSIGRLWQANRGREQQSRCNAPESPFDLGPGGMDANLIHGSLLLYHRGSGITLAERGFRDICVAAPPCG